jgi:hypothetical protein
MLQQRLPIPHRNIAIYYLLTFTQSAAFVNGNWIFFWLRFASFKDLGIFDAVSFAFGLLMEVPTGALADMLGKKYTMVAASLCLGIGFIVMGFATAVWMLVVGFWLAQIGWAFYSGAAQALAFDTLKERGQEALFERVESGATAISNISFVSCVLIGGVLYHIDAGAPHYVWGFVFLIGALASLWLVEPNVPKVPFSLRGYARQLGLGFRQLAAPSVRHYIPMFFAGIGVFYLYSFGLIQPIIALNFGFEADAQSVITAILGVTAAFVSLSVPALRRRLSGVGGLALFIGMMALGFIGSALPLGTVGFVAILLVRLGGSLTQTWTSILINHAIPSETRATTLSTLALLTKIPYVVTAVLAGAMAENGTFGLFSLGVAAFALAGVVITLIWQRSAARANAQVSLGSSLSSLS